MARAGDLAELLIADLSHRGEGVGRLEDEVVFVPGGLPGDRLRIRLQRRQAGHWQAELAGVIEPSADRRRPPCILAEPCGGCSLQPFDDNAEATWKQQLVAETVRRIGGLTPPLRPILRAAGGLGYRNRAILPLERTPEGTLRAGYYRRGSHRIVNLNRCPVLDPRLDALIGPLKQDLEASGWPVDRHGGGGLRHLALRLGSGTGELLITLVAAEAELPGLDRLAQQWLARWPELVGVALNCQSAPDNRLLGEQTRTIAGRSWLEEEFAGLRYRIGADTFFQVNTSQAERMVAPLMEALSTGQDSGNDRGRLIDAYCGIGTFSLPLARQGWRVHGLEQHPASVALAEANAARNGLETFARFEQTPVAPVLADRLRAAAGEAPADLFVDPPRKGLEPEALAAIETALPRCIAYLSCDPATLARDLGRLCRDGAYEVLWLQPADFFPNTAHVECLAALRRR